MHDRQSPGAKAGRRNAYTYTGITTYMLKPRMPDKRVGGVLLAM